MTDSVELGPALRHLFDDEEWITKTVIGGLLAAVPILNFVVIGYELQMIRNVSKGERRPMPAWDDFGRFFTDGLQLGLARIVYGLPLLLLLAPLFFIFFLPFLVVVISGGRDSEATDRLMSLVLGGTMLLGLLAFGAAMAYALLIGALLPAVAANFVKRGTFAACFELRAIFSFIRANFNNYLMVWLTGIVAGLAVYAIYFALNFIPCIGFLFALPVALAGGFFILMAAGHALGQALALEAAPERQPDQLAPT